MLIYMKNRGKITQLVKIIDDNELIRGYLVVVEIKELPTLMLGKCTISQIKKRVNDE